ncbi:HRDC domain-containing protein [Filifactor alocis]
MGLFDRLKEPVFLKESSTTEERLERLKNLEPYLNSDGKTLINQDIKCLEYGMFGEKQIAFELKNSHIPMYILHDVYLEDGELSAQIDYLVFTKKICFVIECKNLIGKIEINNNGDFIRTLEFEGRQRKEGIYSPITQNQRHIELMKKIKIDSKSNRLIKFLAQKTFDSMYQSVVVLANPKTVLNAKFAKKEVKEQVIRVDQLVNYIRKVYEQSSQSAFSDEQLLNWATSYLDFHKDVRKDYTGKYKKYRMNTMTEPSPRTDTIRNEENRILEGDTVFPLEETKLFKELKNYRLRKSREENIKPYFIYNNSQLKKLIVKMPKTIQELQLVDGFGEWKAKKYGCDILEILNKYL